MRSTGAWWLAAVLTVLSGHTEVATLRSQTRNIGTASLAGRVLDDRDGKPIAGARVNLSRDSKAIRETLTDANGEYAFPQLPSGAYQIRAFSPGYLHTSYGQKKPDRAGTPVVIGDRQSLGDLTIRMFRGGVIAGYVSGHNGQPLVGAGVRPYRLNYRAGGQFLDPLELANTDDRGHYRIFGLSPGEYLVRVVNTIGSRMHIADRALEVQWMPAQGYVPTFFPNAPSPNEAARIALGAGEERSGIDFSLPLVPFVRVGGNLQGPTGPVANARFYRVLDDVLLPYGDPLDSSSQPDGRFVLTNIPTGPLTLLVHEEERAARDPSGRLWGTARVAVGGDLSDVVIRMQRGATVTGIVKFSGESAPVDPVKAGWAVGIMAAGPALLSSGEMLTGALNREGRFSVSGLPPGSYYLTTLNFGASWSIASIAHDGVDRTAAALDISHDDVTDLVITLSDRPASLSGTVRVPVGSAVTDYTVVAFPADPASRATRPRAVYAAPLRTNGTFTISRIFSGRYLLALVDDIELNTWFDPRVLERLSHGATPITIGTGESKVQDLRVAAR